MASPEIKSVLHNLRACPDGVLQTADEPQAASVLHNSRACPDGMLQDADVPENGRLSQLDTIPGRDNSDGPAAKP